MGVILYESLSGRRPFPGGYDQAVLYGILNTEPEPLPETVPADLAAVVMRLLQKNPEDRFADAGELLEALGTPEAGPATRSAPKVAGSRTGTRTKQLVSIAIAASVVIAAIVWFASQSPGEPDIAPDPALAVLPFDVQGSTDLAYLGHGMPTLLSAAIGGVGDLRAIDPISVFSFLGDDQIDAEAASRVAARFAAEGVVVGSVTQLGQEIRLQASIHDADGRSGEVIVVTASNQADLPDAVDELGRLLIASRFEGRGMSMARLSAITSNDFEALRFYIDGDALARSGSWQEAYEQFGRAVERDSTFALAWFRMSTMAGWDITGEDPQAEIEAALRHMEGLPARARALIDIQHAHVLDNHWTELELLEVYTRRYPDDAYGWYRMADNMVHYNNWIGRQDTQGLDYLGLALELDPSNFEVLKHLVDFAFFDRNWDRVDSLESLSAGAPRFGTELTGLFRTDPGNEDILAYVSEKGIWQEFLDAAMLIGDADLNQVVLDSIGSIEGTTMRPIGALTRYLREGRYHAGITSLVRVAEASQTNFLQVGWVLWLTPPVFTSAFDSMFGNAIPEPDVIDFVLSDPARADVAFALGVAAIYAEDSTLTKRVVSVLKTYDNPGSLLFASNLEIIESMRTGNFARALEMVHPELHDIESGRQPEGVRYQAVFNNRPTALRRWLRAELLFETGDYQEAADWYRSLHALTDALYNGNLAYSTPAHRRLAEIAEIQGDRREAIRRYELFLDFWKNADPELQPMVVEARERLDVLLARQAGVSGESTQ